MQQINFLLKPLFGWIGLFLPVWSGTLHINEGIVGAMSKFATHYRGSSQSAGERASSSDSDPIFLSPKVVTLRGPSWWNSAVSWIREYDNQINIMMSNGEMEVMWYISHLQRESKHLKQSQPIQVLLCSNND